MSQEKQFQPEYFSGLNRGKATPFLGKTVECSWHGLQWFKAKLSMIDMDGKPFLVDEENNSTWVEYIRTTPETHAHPTINIGGVKLPRPEVETLNEGKEYWFRTAHNSILRDVWTGDLTDKRRLEARNIHGTESRAQAWADWWHQTVVAQLHSR